MKRSLLLALLLAACSSGGGASPDAGAASTPCASLCASSTCPEGCTATCEAGGGAVARCQSQYNAVVQCAVAGGQRCTFAQGGGPSCMTQGQAYADCVSGGAGSDAGGTGSDAGGTGGDAGEGPTDAGTATSASVVGTWEASTTAPMFEYRLELMGGPSSGVATYRSINTLTSSGCVTTNEYEGRWTLAGSSITVQLDTGTTEVTGCTDSSRNAPSMALPDSNVTSVGSDYTGPVTVSATELIFTAFRGSSMRTFTRRAR